MGMPAPGTPRFTGPPPVGAKPRPHPSPNFGPRRDGLTPSLVVLHYTAMIGTEAELRALCDPAREVSAHYLITPDGALIQLVDEKMRAWHAGHGSWLGQDDINSRSIGIELSNTGLTPFAEPQMAALEALLPGILARWQIPPQGVIGHSDMAPARKIDPGTRFDWRRLAHQGLSVWPDDTAAQAAPDTFRTHARAFGYPDAPDDLLLSAVRLRFRPWARGPLDQTDAGIAENLCRRFGV